MFQKVFPYTKTIAGLSINSLYLPSGRKNISFGQKQPQQNNCWNMAINKNPKKFKKNSTQKIHIYIFQIYEKLILDWLQTSQRLFLLF